MHIVLVEPEIPGNTGNISRLCAANHLVLHLVKPLGFSIDDKHLKRAGLDYWDLLEVHIHENYQALVEYLKGRRFWFNTTKAEKSYTDVRFTDEDVLVFGKETKGLPEELLAAHPEQCIRIPMRAEARSLNLSNAVAIVSYEPCGSWISPRWRKKDICLKGKEIPMNMYDDAYNLAKSIRESAEMKQLIAAKEKLAQDASAKDLAEEFLALQMEAEYRRMLQKTDGWDGMEKLQSLQVMVQNNSLASEYLHAFMRWQQVAADIQKIVSDAISEGVPDLSRFAPAEGKQ